MHNCGTLASAINFQIANLTVKLRQMGDLTRIIEFASTYIKQSLRLATQLNQKLSHV